MRQTFTTEHKIKIVKMVLEQEMSINDVCKAEGVKHSKNVRRWKNLYLDGLLIESNPDSGGSAIRGFVIQALMALLQVCHEDCRLIHFEPSNKKDEKVDFWWEDGNGAKYAVQVKSTKNEFTKEDVESWANDLRKNHEDMACKLILVGTYQQPKEPLKTEVEIEIKPFDENIERCKLEVWKEAERGIVDLLDKRKLAIGKPIGWNRAVTWVIGKFLTNCDKPMTPEDFINALKEIVIAGTDFQDAIDHYRKNTIDDLSKRKDSFSKKLFSEMFVEQDFYDPPLSSQASGEKSPRTNNFKMVEDHPRLFILSEPGMGKSTFLNALALQYARDAEKPLPILIRLREKLPNMKAIAKTIGINYTDRPRRKKNLIRDMLQAGRALLILDGLDEIEVEKINKIKAFIEELNPARCLITCRLSHGSEGAAFESDENFKRVQMAKFSREQIERFADCCFAETNDSENFKPEVHNNKNLTELASQPLLLALLCLTFEKTKTFSQSRAAIYKAAIEMLLQEWDTDKVITRKSCFGYDARDEKVAILSEMAYENVNANRYRIDKKALGKILSEKKIKLPSVAILREIASHHGILVKQIDGNYEFLHRTFQEYFAALAIAGDLEYKLKGNPAYLQELMQHIHVPRWREVFLLTASLLDNADDFFALFREALASDVKLHPTLNWAKNKYPAIAGAESMPTRFFTLAFSVAYSITPVPTLIRDAAPSRLRHNLVRNIDLVLDLACDLGRVLRRARALDRELARSLYIIRNLARNLASAIEYAHDDINHNHYTNTDEFDFDEFDHAIARSHACKLNHKYIRRDYLLITMSMAANTLSWFPSSFAGNNVKQAIQQGVVQLLEWDISLSLPPATETKADWQAFAEVLKTAMAQYEMHRMFQVQAMNNYFSGNKLLLDCLAIATVTDREAIRNSLFLPPQESASGG